MKTEITSAGSYWAWPGARSTSTSVALPALPLPAITLDAHA
ncbi:hypothetical protein [Nocardioides sp.]|nr:hypothetical protein [Nocardioides sp.]